MMNRNLIDPFFRGVQRASFNVAKYRQFCHLNSRPAPTVISSVNHHKNGLKLYRNTIQPSRRSIYVDHDHPEEASKSILGTTSGEKFGSSAQDFTAFDASSWWSPSGPFGALHSMNTLRVPWIRGILENDRRAGDAGKATGQNNTGSGFDSGLRTRKNGGTAAGAENPETDGEFGDGFLGQPYEPLAGFRILDAGCGAGILAEPLARLGALVTGLDRAPEVIEIAEGHALEQGLAGRIEYHVGDVSSFYGGHPNDKNHQNIADGSGSDTQANSNLGAENASFGNSENAGIEAKFDAVIASEVIEHVPNSDKIAFLSACAARLPQGRHLFLTTLNQTPWSRLLGIYAAENVLGLVPQGIHDWDLFISPADLGQMCESVGFRVSGVHGMVFNPVWNTWGWRGWTGINYAIHAVKN